MDEQFREYLGDGVYASFDGYQIWLSTGHHNNRVVALEPEVFSSLVQYQRKLIQLHCKHEFSEQPGEPPANNVCTKCGARNE